ncbi:BTB/POZ and TAZ domain-containing protein 4 [Apostasia shenzhenica]|uniref:BTB/POZ and TAZ domain-containing protein 4 n=1 Tax=Apostasia shenzhenica TaxID=1088818 RepID=A0A2I0AWH6_9ASPA|nr:BTB/POZ and TAZ domain-containing protein 4 [Apostasia shenzhenica]
MAERRRGSPKVPPFLGLNAGRRTFRQPERHCRSTAAESIRDLWDQLFAEGYRADVCVHTNSGIIPAHASVLGMASPVMKQMLRQFKSRGGRRKAISIGGVPHQAVWVFLRFIYSSCYEEEEMNQYVLHLLVLSHVFGIPSLKKVCVQHLEKGLLSVDNVVDVFQLGQLCDAPRLSLLCHRMIVANFQEVSASEGWKVMKESNPKLEKELLQSVVEADSRKKERLKKKEERRIYLQLHEAMEALVHICRDGCRTIGPHDKVLKRSSGPCKFPACKGLESLVRHFAGCKNRVSGGCNHCKRMWQLLELHSRLCEEEGDGCKVPLCRHFKEKRRRQNRKEEVKWKLLVSKVLEAKSYAC